MEYFRKLLISNPLMQNFTLIKCYIFLSISKNFAHLIKLKNLTHLLPYYIKILI